MLEEIIGGRESVVVAERNQNGAMGARENVTSKDETQLINTDILVSLSINIIVPLKTSKSAKRRNACKIYFILSTVSFIEAVLVVGITMTFDLKVLEPICYLLQEDAAIRRASQKFQEVYK